MSQQASGEQEEFHGWGSWLLAALVVVGLGLTLWLLPRPRLQSASSAQHAEAVSVSERGLIRIKPNTPFARRLVVMSAVAKQTEQPLLVVTGTVLAAVTSASGGAQPKWQFASAELVTTFAEWSQSYADVGFHQRQAVNTKDLVETRVRSQSEVVGRLERLVEVGSDSPRDLNLERANLLERKLEADRQTHEATATLHAAERHQAALELQLEQAGLSPELLRDPVPGRALVVAEVPETRMAGVREGQRCSVRFYADPDTELQGKVARILPTVSTAQRALRVLIVLDGAKDSLRPGMFADVGIGTDKRAAVRIPPRAVVHVGHSDYVLVQRGDEYEVCNVSLGAAENGSVEVLEGVKQGERVLADGVVLLKPVIASVVHAEALL